MPTRINRLSGLGAFLVLAAASPAFSQAERESPATDVDSRWIPSFSFTSGATMQYMNSSTMARCELGRPEEAVDIQGVNIFIDRLACRDPDGALTPPPITPGLMDPFCSDIPSPDGRNACLRPSDRDDDLAVSAYVGTSLQLMTPRIEPLPGAPRLFVMGELLTIYGQERSIAREGNPSSLDFPANSPRNARATSGATLFGVGSELRSEVQRLAWGARAGLAFPFQFLERRLWLKPAFGWFQYEVDFDGSIIAGIKDDPVDDPNAFTFGPGIREVRFFGSGSETFDGIGPSLELEMEVGRFGPLGVALFLDADAYWVLGERRFDFSGSLHCTAFDDAVNPGSCASSLVEDADLLDPNNPPTLVPDAAIAADNYSADFHFSVDPVVYRGGVGIRFHWLGR
jgi:hypothetical protein